MNRKICVVTGTRAEYGLLSNLMREIQKDEFMELQIITTGTHLSPEFGYTISEIYEDGFIVDEKVEMLLSADSSTAIAKSLGIATMGFATAFERLQPDIVVILGDRFEILAVAQTALIMNIPIAHISGGEITEGAIDDAIRHAITKLSHIHFPATDAYKKRIIQLGEQPELVFNVGDPGVENIRKLQFIEKHELEMFFDMNLDNTLLVTFHPATLNKEESKYQIEILIASLIKCDEYNVIFTKGNADTDGRIINNLIDDCVAKYPQRFRAYTSLGKLRYLSTLKYCKACIGNSSSGIVEAPVYGIATVNIGDRQDGRLKASSIIDCEVDKMSISSAIQKAVSREFQQSLEKMTLEYDGYDTSIQIKEILKTIRLDNIIKKKFYDIQF